jgi:hypothetical protein
VNEEAMARVGLQRHENKQHYLVNNDDNNNNELMLLSPSCESGCKLYAILTRMFR